MSLKRYLQSIILGRRKSMDAVFIWIFLTPLAIIYYVGVSFWVLLYCVGFLPRTRVPVPVISVGNITVGGTGKTPVVIWLVKYLQSIGRRPAVVLRGYMDGGSAVESDEAKLLRESLPGVNVVPDRDRVRACFKVIEVCSPDVIVLDDGFQHWRLYRDLDIVTIDARNPFGNGWTLPAGILREPFIALRRAGILLLTKTGTIPTGSLISKLRQFNQSAVLAASDHVPEKLIGLHDGKEFPRSRFQEPMALLSAIADPDAFRFSVLQLGIEPKETFEFIDHHSYTTEDIQRVVAFCRDQSIRGIITTQKDAVKLSAFKDCWGDCAVYILKINLTITHGQEEIVARINHLLSR